MLARITINKIKRASVNIRATNEQMDVTKEKQTLCGSICHSFYAVFYCEKSLEDYKMFQLISFHQSLRILQMSLGMILCCLLLDMYIFLNI